MNTSLCSLAGVTADEVRYAGDPWRRVPCFDLDGMGPVELAHLGEALGCGSHDVLRRGFSLLAGEMQESPWVIGVPDDIVRKLRALSRASLAGTAASWRAAVDLGTAPAEELLRRLVRFITEHECPFAVYATAGPT